MLKTFLILFAALICGSVGYSQERDPAAIPFNVLPPKKPNPFNVGFRESYYLGNKDSLLGDKHFEEVTARIRGQSNSDFIQTGIDIGGSTAINISNYVSFYAPEAYFRFILGSTPKPNSPLLTFGRKKDRWSLLDSFWELGTWQPQYRWDYLRPEEQGLAGAFLEIPGDNWRFVLFGSPLYVPESGAPYRLKDHELVSNSPWFFDPADELIVIKPPATAVQYTLEIPPIENIVRQSSIGATFEAGARTTGWWGRASYIYKPRNQLDLPFTGKLQISGTGTTYVDVHIFPAAIYHHLAALDFGYKTQNFSFWVANLYDHPINQSYDTTEYTSQVLYPTYFLSPGVEYSHTTLGGLGVDLIGSYLYKNGKDPTEVGVNASSSNPVFGLPYNFTNAARGAVRISYPVMNGYRSSFLLEYTQNFDDQASWIKGVGEWTFSEQIRATLEGDLLGSLAGRDDNHFLSRYRGNDRIIASGSYLF